MDFKVAGTIICACLLLVFAQAGSTAQTCTTLRDLAEPCGCTITADNFDPVCGTDGHTYMNPCFLFCRETVEDVRIGMEHQGVCTNEANCHCHAAYEPVCGTNGVTYSNDCVLKCNQNKDPSLRLAHSGNCRDYDDGSSEKTWLRSRYYAPSLRSYAQSLRSFAPSLRSFAPGSRSYALGSRSYTPGLRSHIPICVCDPGNGPVCASDGNTYANSCVVRCKAIKDKSIKFVHWGTCRPAEKKEKSEESVSSEESVKPNRLSGPVQTPPPPKQKKCACSETISYYTRCGNGQVKPNPACACPQKTQQLKLQDTCAEKHSNNYEKLSGPGNLQKLNLVVTKTCFCAAYNRPVCGNNQQTYANVCVLYCNTKKDTSLRFQRWGPCGDDVRLISRHNLDLYKDETFLRKRHRNNFRNNYEK